MKNRIYFDNASTSFPKAPGVSEAMRVFMDEIGCNVSRGSYADAYTAAEIVFDTREKLAQLFGGLKSKNVIFTPNITASLNVLIKGLFKPGDHVLVSSMEHNSVMRPLVQMQKQGVRFSRIPCDEQGTLQLDTIESMIFHNTKAIICLHASNVSGTLLPAAQLGGISREHGLIYILDTAQTAGVFPLDMEAMNVDALAFTGHKSLLGPQGIGGFTLTDELAAKVEPLISGGTGSISNSEEIPAFLPDRFEAGTLNLPGVFGLHKAIEYIENAGIDFIRDKEQWLAQQLWNGLEKLIGVRMVGSRNLHERAPIVSVDFSGHDNADISFQLADKYNILTRCGLHCAPHAHKTLGTFPQGTVRFSLNHFNTENEVDICLEAIKSIIK